MDLCGIQIGFRRNVIKCQARVKGNQGPHNTFSEENMSKMAFKMLILTFRAPKKLVMIYSDKRFCGYIKGDIKSEECQS